MTWLDLSVTLCFPVRLSTNKLGLNHHLAPSLFCLGIFETFWPILQHYSQIVIVCSVGLQISSTMTTTYLFSLHNLVLNLNFSSASSRKLGFTLTWLNHGSTTLALHLWKNPSNLINLCRKEYIPVTLSLRILLRYIPKSGIGAVWESRKLSDVELGTLW